mmetsp:Transcript_59812/g.146884  ORF Transcript_59812/g.146884 Transcript_59812/m.146884 type:complete len:100 (-) Transcript_59812:356-655(-)
MKWMICTNSSTVSMSPNQDTLMLKILLSWRNFDKCKSSSSNNNSSRSSSSSNSNSSSSSNNNRKEIDIGGSKFKIHTCVSDGIGFITGREGSRRCNIAI